MPNYTYECLKCEATFDKLVPIAERDHQFCIGCGSGDLRRPLVAPNVTRASYIDGTKRKGFQDLREANKLVREASQSKKETAKEIRKEIGKMGVKVEK